MVISKEGDCEAEIVEPIGVSSVGVVETFLSGAVIYISYHNIKYWAYLIKIREIMSIPSIYKDDIVFLAKKYNKTIRKFAIRHS